MNNPEKPSHGVFFDDSVTIKVDEDFEAEPASRAEIERHGWSRYVVGEFQE